MSVTNWTNQDLVELVVMGLELADYCADCGIVLVEKTGDYCADCIKAIDAMLRNLNAAYTQEGQLELLEDELASIKWESIAYSNQANGGY